MRVATTNKTKKGFTHLYVIPDTTWFQGHFIDCDSMETFGLFGEERVKDNATFDCCRGDDPFLLYDLSIINFKSKKEKKYIVQKKGGDYVNLESPEVTFITDQLKVDNEADNYIETYFPASSKTQLLGKNANICIGTMELVLDDLETLSSYSTITTTTNEENQNNDLDDDDDF